MLTLTCILLLFGYPGGKLHAMLYCGCERHPILSVVVASRVGNVWFSAIILCVVVPLGAALADSNMHPSVVQVSSW